jgi:alpha-tubulin suppressor-like RCC1 family protein
MQGTCELQGFCAFPDPTCPAGERFEPNAGNGLGGKCVGGTTTCGSIGGPCCNDNSCVANGFCSSGTCMQCFTDIAIGAESTCALRYDGTVWCGGENGEGQLGNNAIGGAPQTARVQARDAAANTPIHDAMAIVAGDGHFCVLRAAGAVSCWGKNDDGQLGDNTNNNNGGAVPATLESNGEALAGMISLAAGHDTTCAVDGVTNQLLCWGFGKSATLGDGTLNNRSRAAPVLQAAAGAPFANVAAATIGIGDHACLRTTDSQVWCWGVNDNGQVGNNTMTQQTVPVHVDDGYSAVAAGRQHTCATKSADGGVFCWGSSGRGRLGVGMNAPNQLVPGPALTSAGGPPFAGAAGIAAAGSSCAVTTRGDLYCWGMNPHGQIGTGVGVYVPTPVIFADGTPLRGVKRVVTGYATTCAFLIDGELLCWGKNASGQLAEGTFISRNAPAPIKASCP